MTLSSLFTNILNNTRIPLALSTLLGRRYPTTGAQHRTLITEADLFYAYRLYLNREPTAAERLHYDVYLGDLSPTQLTSMLLTSAEFKQQDIFYKVVGDYRNEAPLLIDLGQYKQFVLPQDESIGKTIAEHHIWEPHVTSVMRNILQPGMTMIDMGANIGYFTLLASHQLGPAGRVIAFEPNHLNCNLIYMSSLINGFENIDIFPVAVGDGYTPFVLDLQDGSNGAVSTEVSTSTSSIHLKEGLGDGVNHSYLLHRKLTCTVLLDHVLADLPQIDVIKMDIEGSEYRALCGMKQLIQQHRPIIFSEFAPASLQGVSHVSGETYLQALIDHGYTLSIIELDGTLMESDDRPSSIMKIYRDRKVGLIDLIAHPL